MITIVDYGLGNIASILNMIRKVGGKARVSSDANNLLTASKLIIPGVGSFDHGAKQLEKMGLFSAIQEIALKETPILGICLGMQLLANRSEEGKMKGLGLIDADFKRFSFPDNSTNRIPHVGWNHVTPLKDNLLIPNDNSEQRFYFTHSYHAVCKNDSDVLATTEYGYSFTTAYFRNNIFGVQFHPEKSHRFGMSLMKRFLDF